MARLCLDMIKQVFLSSKSLFRNAFETETSHLAHLREVFGNFTLICLCCHGNVHFYIFREILLFSVIKQRDVKVPLKEEHARWEILLWLPLENTLFPISSLLAQAIKLSFGIVSVNTIGQSSTRSSIFQLSMLGIAFSPRRTKINE